MNLVIRSNLAEIATLDNNKKPVHIFEPFTPYLLCECNGQVFQTVEQICRTDHQLGLSRNFFKLTFQDTASRHEFKLKHSKLKFFDSETPDDLRHCLDSQTNFIEPLCNLNYTFIFLVFIRSFKEDSQTIWCYFRNHDRVFSVKKFDFKQIKELAEYVILCDPDFVFSKEQSDLIEVFKQTRQLEVIEWLSRGQGSSSLDRSEPCLFPNQNYLISEGRFVLGLDFLAHRSEFSIDLHKLHLVVEETRLIPKLLGFLAQLNLPFYLFVKYGVWGCKKLLSTRMCESTTIEVGRNLEQKTRSLFDFFFKTELPKVKLDLETSDENRKKKIKLDVPSGMKKECLALALKFLALSKNPDESFLQSDLIVEVEQFFQKNPHLGFDLELACKYYGFKCLDLFRSFIIKAKVGSHTKFSLKTKRLVELKQLKTLGSDPAEFSRRLSLNDPSATLPMTSWLTSLSGTEGLWTSVGNLGFFVSVLDRLSDADLCRLFQGMISSRDPVASLRPELLSRLNQNWFPLEHRLSALKIVCASMETLIKFDKEIARKVFGMLDRVVSNDPSIDIYDLSCPIRYQTKVSLWRHLGEKLRTGCKYLPEGKDLQLELSEVWIQGLLGHVAINTAAACVGLIRPSLRSSDPIVDLTSSNPVFQNEDLVPVSFLTALVKASSLEEVDCFTFCCVVSNACDRKYFEYLSPEVLEKVKQLTKMHHPEDFGFLSAEKGQALFVSIAIDLFHRFRFESEWARSALLESAKKSSQVSRETLENHLACNWVKELMKIHEDHHQAASAADAATAALVTEEVIEETLAIGHLRSWIPQGGGCHQCTPGGSNYFVFDALWKIYSIGSGSQICLTVLAQLLETPFQNFPKLSTSAVFPRLQLLSKSVCHSLQRLPRKNFEEAKELKTINYHFRILGALSNLNSSNRTCILENLPWKKLLEVFLEIEANRVSINTFVLIHKILAQAKPATPTNSSAPSPAIPPPTLSTTTTTSSTLNKLQKRSASPTPAASSSSSLLGQPTFQIKKDEVLILEAEKSCHLVLKILNHMFSCVTNSSGTMSDVQMLRKSCLIGYEIGNLVLECYRNTNEAVLDVLRKQVALAIIENFKSVEKFKQTLFPENEELRLAFAKFISLALQVTPILYSLTNFFAHDPVVKQACLTCARFLDKKAADRILAVYGLAG